MASDMIHYFATFELPDGEHNMHGWSESMSTARLHVDGYILNRRRANIPHEKCRLLRIWQVAPGDVEKTIKEEDDRIRAKYPNREHVSEAFDTPNRILESPVTDLPEQV